jgi:hypothetical protein
MWIKRPLMLELTPRNSKISPRSVNRSRYLVWIMKLMNVAVPYSRRALISGSKILSMDPKRSQLMAISVSLASA